MGRRRQIERVTESTTTRPHFRPHLQVLVADGFGSVNESLTAPFAELAGMAVCGGAREPAMARTVHPPQGILRSATRRSFRTASESILIHEQKK